MAFKTEYFKAEILNLKKKLTEKFKIQLNQKSVSNCIHVPIKIEYSILKLQIKKLISNKSLKIHDILKFELLIKSKFKESKFNLIKSSKLNRSSEIMKVKYLSKTESCFY